MANITFELNQNGTGTIKISIAMTEETFVNQMRTAIDSVFASNQDFLRIANRSEATNTAGTKRILKINLSNPTTLSTDRALAELICEFFKIANRFNLTINIVQNAASQYIDNIRSYVNNASIRAEFPTVMGYLAHSQASSAALNHAYGDSSSFMGMMSEHEGMDFVITNITSSQFTSEPETREFLRNLISSSATSSVRSLRVLPTIEYYLISLDRGNDYTELNKVNTALRSWIARTINPKEEGKEISLQEVKCSVTLDELDKDSDVEVFLSKNDKGDYNIQVYSANVSSGMEGKFDIDPNTKGSILAISKGTLKSLLNNLDPESDAVINKPKLQQ